MKRYYIGIDIGATNTKYALLNKNARIKKKLIIDTDAYKNSREFVSISRDIIFSLLKEFKLKLKEISGIGIGAPGAIDSQRGIVHYFTNIKGWKEVPLKKMMEAKIKLPMYIDNDVNVMVMGEYFYGAGKNTKNMVGLTLGSGVGGGLILDGKVYRGTNLAAGEIGHIPINTKGPRCNCGGTACIERYIGNKYIVERYHSKVKSQKSKVKATSQKSKLERLTPKIIYERAKKGEKKAIDILNETGKYLGISLAGTVNLLNPEIIVIGGGVANAGHFIFKNVKNIIKKQAMKLPGKTVKVVKAKLGEDAGLIGAVALVKEKIG